MKTLNMFIQARILQQLGHAALARFLDAFELDLKAMNLFAPPPLPATHFYFTEVADFLVNTNPLPPRLLDAMFAIEAHANHSSCSDNATLTLDIRPETLDLGHPLSRALDLWFSAPEIFSGGGPAAPTCPAIASERRRKSDEGGSPSSSSSCSSSSSISDPDRGTSPARGSHGSATAPEAPTPSEAPAPVEPAKITDNGQLITDNRLPITGNGLPVANPQPQSTDAATFRALAQLSPADYDRTRKQSARSLGIRVETLDSEVTRVRNQLVEDAMLQTALATLRSPEPWPEPVNGAEVLTQIVERFLYYVFLPPGAPEAFTLWSAHAHCFLAFIQSPRLNICSPEGGCGKTTALDVIATLTPRALRTENLTAPVLFRLVHQYQPTLLLDEVDSWLPQAEELRGLLNAGHKRGACAYRCEGEGNAVRPFRAFGPAVLSGIGQLTGTLHDRSIVVPLMKAEAGQILHRFDNHRIEIETELCRKLARWTSDTFAALKSCEPPLPPTAFNRLADNWRPLFAIAQIAGGPWPELALNSFNHLSNPRLPLLKSFSSSFSSSSSSPERSEVPIQNRDQLITDLRHIFAQSGATRLSSAQLVEALCALTDRPYAQPSSLSSDPRRLARILRPLGINSRTLRFDGRLAKGYLLADLPKAA